MAEREFRIAYAPGARQVLTAIGCGPRNSGVLVTGQSMQVWMGWSFRATVPLSAIAAADPDDRAVLGVGVHGWDSVWLVNGSWTDLVRIQLDVGVRARVMGRQVPLTTLVVSVEERDDLVRLIRPDGRGRGNIRIARARRIRLPGPVLKPGLASQARMMTDGPEDRPSPGPGRLSGPRRTPRRLSPTG